MGRRSSIDIVNQFTDWVTSSGYKGTLEEFTQEVINITRWRLNSSLKNNGNLHETDMNMLIERLRDGKNQNYNITDEALNLLENIIKKEIPRGDIIAEGDNIAINNSSVSVNSSVDYKKLWEHSQEEIRKLQREVAKLELELEAAQELLNERRS